MSIFGNESALSGIVLAAMTVFVIERQLWRAAAFAATGAGLTFIGMMHGEHVAIGQNPSLALSYLLVAGIMAACAKFSPGDPLPAPLPSGHE